MRCSAARLTGVRHWQKEAGRAFVLGEFGNQPWTITGVASSGGVVTFTTANSFPADVGDRIGVVGTGTALDGQWFTVQTINALRNSVTVNTNISASFSGSVKGLLAVDEEKLMRLGNDIANSDVDVALWWMIDSDLGRPVGESIHDPVNARLAEAIKTLNALYF